MIGSSNQGHSSSSIDSSGTPSSSSSYRYPANLNLNPERLLSHVKEMMKRLRSYDGVITMRRFTEFFSRNGFEEETLQGIVEWLELEQQQQLSHLQQAQNDQVDPSLSSALLPKIWEQSVKDVLGGAVSDKNPHSRDMVTFLLAESFGIRLSILDSFFEQKVLRSTCIYCLFWAIFFLNFLYAAWVRNNKIQSTFALFREFSRWSNTLPSGILDPVLSSTSESSIMNSIVFRHFRAVQSRYKEFVTTLLSKFEPVV